MAVEKVNSSSSLAEVVDRILDKGIVVDAWVRVSLVGIELLSIEARVVIASVETYLKYAEAVGLTTQAAVPAAKRSSHGAGEFLDRTCQIPQHSCIAVTENPESCP